MKSEEDESSPSRLSVLEKQADIPMNLSTSSSFREIFFLLLIV